MITPPPSTLQFIGSGAACSMTLQMARCPAEATSASPKLRIAVVEQRQHSGARNPPINAPASDPLAIQTRRFRRRAGKRPPDLAGAEQRRWRRSSKGRGRCGRGPLDLRQPRRIGRQPVGGRFLFGVFLSGADDCAIAALGSDLAQRNRHHRARGHDARSGYYYRDRPPPVWNGVQRQLLQAKWLCGGPRPKPSLQIPNRIHYINDFYPGERATCTTARFFHDRVESWESATYWSWVTPPRWKRSTNASRRASTRVGPSPSSRARRAAMICNQPPEFDFPAAARCSVRKA